MKKLLAILLAAMMVFALCAGCSSSSDSGEDIVEEVTEDVVTDLLDDLAGDDDAAAADAAAEAPAGELVEGDDSGESSQEQTLELFPSDGYEKTFDGYIAWVRAALESQTGNPNLESDLAELDEVTEDTYSADNMPFSMQIQFGLITSYEDFIG